MINKRSVLFEKISRLFFAFDQEEFIAFLCNKFIIRETYEGYNVFFPVNRRTYEHLSHRPDYKNNSRGGAGLRKTMWLFFMEHKIKDVYYYLNKLKELEVIVDNEEFEQKMKKFVDKFSGYDVDNVNYE